MNSAFALMKYSVLISCFLGTTLSFAQIQSDTLSSGQFIPPAGPLKPAFFTELPVGSIEPRGWLKEWCLTLRDGLVGHLDDKGQILHEDLNGNWGVDPRGGEMIANKDFWPYEISGQWLEALVRMGYAMKDSMLMQKATNQIEAILARQGTDGYLGWIDHPKQQPPSARDRWKRGGDSHWGMCPMLRALLAYHSATGDSRIIPALERHFENYRFTLEQFNARNKTSEPRNFANIEVMLEVYKRGGNQKMLANALNAGDIMIRDRQKNQVPFDLALQEDYVPSGHGDRFVELVKMFGLFYPWTGNLDHLNATMNALEKLQSLSVLPHGIPEASEFIECRKEVNARTEVTTVSNYLYTLLKALQITADSRYADRVEKMFFNACAGNVSDDGKRTPYYAVPNRIEGRPFVLRGNQHGEEWTELAWTGHNQVNFTRIPGNYVTHMWMSTGDGGVAANLYGPCEFNAMVGQSKRVKFEVVTDYPFENRITIELKETDTPLRFPIYLRLPDWCDQWSVKVNNRKKHLIRDDRGYGKIERSWKVRDKVSLTMEMPVRIAISNSQNDDAGYPFSYIERGPLLFGLPISTIDENTARGDTKFHYALDVNQEEIESGFALKSQAVRMPFRWNKENAPISIEVSAQIVPWRLVNGYPIPPESIVPSNEKCMERISLIPMAFTPLRVVFFGVTDRTVNSLTLE